MLQCVTVMIILSIVIKILLTGSPRIARAWTLFSQKGQQLNGACSCTGFILAKDVEVVTDQQYLPALHCGEHSLWGAYETSPCK